MSLTTTYSARQAPNCRPLVGHALQLIRDPLAFFGALPMHGDLVAVKLGPAEMTVVCHPDLVHRLLVEDRVFDKGGLTFTRARAVVGNGLASCPHDDHRRQRRLVQPAFRPARMSGYADVMAEEISAVVDVWEDGGVIDLYGVMAAMTCRVTARALFSASEAVAQTDEFIESMEAMLTALTMRLFIPRSLLWAPLPGKFRFDRACARIRRISQQIIDYYRRAGVDHGDVMSMLLAASDGGEPPLSDAEVGDQITTLYLAGTATTASALAWALYLLAEHPDVERRLHAEVDAALGAWPASFHDVPNLPFTRQVIDEALRLYPPAWMFTRVATVDTELGGHSIAAGSTLLFSAYVAHRHPSMGADRYQFFPDRHAGHPRVQRGGYVPFGAGARKCVGNIFGLTEATIALASIAARWRLEAIPRTAPRPRRVARVTLVPRQVRLRLRRRVADGRAVDQPTAG